ncbi:MAG: DNA replication/repair protein RecF [Chloroflexi bacterium]|nr:DNA replication/repair protein RecF [Chloroflexota bacterium]
MHIRRLSLENFRNIQRLTLDFPVGHTVLHGENAQGKTNLLEAVHVFATGKSIRAETERDIIRWEAHGDEIPFARLQGLFRKANRDLQLDVVLQISRAEGVSREEEPQLVKRIRVNGAPKRAAALIGEVQAVLFEPQDIELVYGSPGGRRRHLDATLSQVDRVLFDELTKYGRVLEQRNPLLKAIREGRAAKNDLHFWDDRLIQSGSAIIAARAQALRELALLCQAVHGELTGGKERLEVVYKPSVPLLGEGDEAAIAKAFAAQLAAQRERELAQGVSVVGPHRDDFSFLVSGVELASFGSRGQQRLATLALKLGEARYMTARTGEQPILLLDDVLSELDAPRRSFLLQNVSGHEQSILTTADLPSLDAGFRRKANLLRVSAGAIGRDA